MRKVAWCLLLTIGRLWAGDCGDSATSITEIQGAGTSSRFANQTVEIEAIVTAQFQQSGQLGGFFVQDLEPHRYKSSGLYVYDHSPVRVGERIRLKGTIKEYYDLTELTQVTVVSRCAIEAIPAPEILKLPVSLAKLESLEGMRVTLESPVLTRQDQLIQFGQIRVANERVFAMTQYDITNLSLVAQLTIDDALNGIKPKKLTLFETTIDPLRLGTVFESVTGVLTYRYGEFQVFPDEPLKLLHKNVREAVAPKEKGQLRFATMNLKNYFNGNGRGGGFPTARGAKNEQELTVQIGKISQALRELDADILVLTEIENDGFTANSAVQQLARSLNLNQSKEMDYRVVITNKKKVGSDAIQNVILYRPARVSTDGTLQIINKAEVPSWRDKKHRQSLAQTFIDRKSGTKFVVVANHFRSKNGRCDTDTAKSILRFGACNGERVQAANAVAQWLGSMNEGGELPTIIMGDFNAYTFEPPLKAFETHGYIRSAASEHDYSYVYQGVSGALDHALVNKQARRYITATGYWHINADEPWNELQSQYNPENVKGVQQANAQPYRSSDHDPLYVDLMF